VTYARGTDVSSERSRGEIERTLKKYGAHAFAYGWDKDKALVQFEMRGRVIRFLLPLPDIHDPEFTRTPTGRPRAASAASEAHEAEVRRSWRALALLIKAKLVAVNDNITEFDEEFLGRIVLPSGETVGDWITPQIEIAYQTGEMPRMLPG
jgi:hypothetical protein